MPVINLYDQLTGLKTPGGNWVYLSGSTTPSPIITGNTVDTDPLEAGTYTFGYNVIGSSCSDSAQVQLVIADTISVSNDICDNSFFLGTVGEDINQITITNQSFEAICGLNGQATLSNLVLPNTWSAGVNQDLWYSFNVDYPNLGQTQNITVNVELTSIGQVDPLENIYGALYDNCSGALLSQSILSPSTNQFATVTYTDTAVWENRTLYLRVGNVSPNAGTFNINITTF